MSMKGACLWAVPAAAAFFSGCAAVPELKTRVETEVREASEAAAGGTAVGGAPFQLRGRPEPEDLVCGVILGDHPYRIAVSDVRLADLQREDAKWKPWPRLVTEGWIEVPVGDESDTYLSGGLYLRFDLVRAILYKNAVTVAEVMQAISQQRRLDAANGAVVLFLKRAVEVEAAQRAQEHRRRAGELIARAEADGDSLFKAGKLPSHQWYIWKRRRVENEVEAEQLDIRLQKAQRELARSYRGARPLQDVLGYADRFIDGFPPVPEMAPGMMPSVLMRSPGVTGARLALFLAEVSILEARLKRLPGAHLDLGGGNIPLRGNDGTDHSGIVPAGGVSMTLYDFGEIARGVRRAELETAQARERMLQAVETARSSIESASQQRRQTQAMVDSAVKRCAAMREMESEIRALMNVGKMSVMDVHETEWMRLDAEAMLERCRNDRRLAVVEDRYARNEVLDEERRKRAFFGYADGSAGQKE
jgi:outer membrane protein TolC